MPESRFWTPPNKLVTLEYFPIKVNINLWVHPKGHPEIIEEIIHAGHNLITTTGKELVARMVSEEAGWNTGVTFCELGVGTTTPVVGDTQIETTTKRNAITTTVRGGATIQFRTFYVAADISVFLKEVGLFGHSTATSTTNTGEMFNHAVISFDNSSGSKDLTVSIQVAFG